MVSFPITAEILVGCPKFDIYVPDYQPKRSQDAYSNLNYMCWSEDCSTDFESSMRD